MYIYETGDSPLNARYVAYNDNGEKTFCSIIIYKDLKEIRIWGFLDNYFFIKQNEKTILDFFYILKNLIMDSNFLLEINDYCIPKDTFGNRIFHDWLNGDLYQTYGL